MDYYGLPPPPLAFGQPLPLSVGDVVELTRAEVDLQWWEVRGHHSLAHTHTHTHTMLSHTHTYTQRHTNIERDTPTPTHTHT